MEAEAAELSAQESTFAFRVKGIVLVLVAGLSVRLILATLPGFAIDLGSFQGWANQLAHDGPWNFYKSDFFTDYAPGYMYVLLAIGKLHQWFNFSQDEYNYVLKLPSIAADLGSAYLLYRLVKERSVEMALGSAALYLLFPAALWIGPIWGQVDSLLALFLLLSIYFISQDRPVAGAVAYTVGFLTKPQAIAALPFLTFWIMREHWPKWSERGPELWEPLKLWLKCGAAALAVLLILVIPFFTYKPWELIDQLNDATNVYKANSFWAYNFWNMFENYGFRCDVSSGCAPGAPTSEFLGVATRFWGFLLFGLSVAAIIGLLRNNRSTGGLALGTALCVFAFYLFLTRMHERYVFAFFLPFLAACALIQSRALWAAFAGLGAIHFFNLYHVYIYYWSFNYPNRPQELKVDPFYSWFEDSSFLGSGLDTIQVLSILMVGGFLVLLGLAYHVGSRRVQATAT